MKRDKINSYVWSYYSGNIFWGWFFLLLGLFFLARNFGWIPNISIWPVLLIILGIYMLIPRRD
ncbi:hypothetical protein HYX17_01020 [Candidatus Woesearchaeota archaeon]|nr:hypothetical protein [Candidatus Woesearchaeota archaeon]